MALINVKMTVKQIIINHDFDTDEKVFEYEVKQTTNTVRVAIGQVLTREQLQYYCNKQDWTVVVNS